MGIRYYGYAFDSQDTARALERPRSILGRDPLADAWGLQPGFTTGVATLVQRLPERDMVYLDKAWPELQELTRPVTPGHPARPAFRMFEGEVRHRPDCSWESWVRALRPEEIPAIAADLAAISDEVVARRSWREGHDEAGESYVVHFLRRARRFAAGLAAEGRGMVYMIG